MAFSLASFSLEGRRALVTGGASGIGAAVAKGLAAAGADIAVTWRERAPDGTLDAVRSSGRRAEAVRTDLATLDAAGARDLAAEVRGRLGGLDILVNNAGIIRRADALDTPEDDWRAVLATNLDAVWFLSQAAGRGMAEAGWGRIVTVASVLGFQGGIRVPAYAAAKHAVIGLTRALSNEWAAKGVTVNALAPGYVATDNTRALREDPARSRELLARIPLGRFADPDEMAGAVVFLASDAASYVTGSVLVADGGWTAR